MEKTTGSGVGFTWADLDFLRIYSCYITPNCRLEEFQDFLNLLQNSIHVATVDVIVSGDFNAHAQVWGPVRWTKEEKLYWKWLSP